MAVAAGQFAWYTLMTPDIAGAAAFYAAVAGWQARPMEVAGQPYTMLLAGETPVGGIGPLPEAARPGWIGSVAVDDVDEAAARVQALGGTVFHPATDLAEVGRYAVVADPQGAVFLLLRTALPGSAGAGSAGAGSAWHELIAEDWRAALAFYGALFGWTPAGAVELGGMGTYQMFAAGATVIGGMMNRPPQVPAPGWRYYLAVGPIDPAAARVTAAGGSVLHGPVAVPGGQWVLHGADPQGAMFALVGRR